MEILQIFIKVVVYALYLTVWVILYSEAILPESKKGVLGVIQEIAENLVFLLGLFTIHAILENI